MSKLYFKRQEGVIQAPLSFVGWEGERLESPADLILYEYMIVCGDIGVDPSGRDERLKAFRQTLSDLGHEVIEQ